MAIIGAWYSGVYSKNALSSQSINTEEGIDPRPAIESLDGIASWETSIVDIDTLIQDLQQELLKTWNDPDKALEIRRRIQMLKNRNQVSNVPVETKI